MSQAQRVIELLAGVKKAGSGWLAKCPSHDDSKASLSVSQGNDGRALLKCHAGCSTESIVGALGLEMSDLMPPRIENHEKPVIERTYDYCDELGNLVFQVVRYKPKDFRQRRPNGKGGWDWSIKGSRTLVYALPRLIEYSDRAVVVVEGEKDVEALWGIGVLATCNAGGGGKGKWTADHAAFLRGRKVLLIGDNDDTGRAHVQCVAESLQGVAEYVKVLELPNLPPKGDVSDWIAAGGNKAKLQELAKSAKDWAPEMAAETTVEETGPRVTSLKDAAAKYLDHLKSGKEVLVDTGIPDLDHALGGGVTHGEMVIIAARPSHGKSAIGLQMVYEMSKSGLPCVIISEEMSALALGKRVIQFASEAPEEHWRHEVDVIAAEVNYHFRVRAEITVVESCQSVETAVAKIEELHAADKCKVALIDYAQLLDSKGKDRYERISRVSQTLRMLASRLNIIVIVLAQLNREIESRKTFTPMMSDIKETGQLEQDADVIIFGVWPHRIDPKLDPAQYQFFVGKNRNRAINCGAFECKFLPARQMLVDKPEERYENYEQAFSAFK